MMRTESSEPIVDAQRREAQIRARVEDLADFYRNLMAYLIAVPIQLAVNFLLLPQSGRWSLMVALIWGAILAVHGLKVFVLRGWLSTEWEERKVREYMNRTRRN